MLYWGMFTAGFIVGGILSSFLFSKKFEDGEHSVGGVNVSRQSFSGKKNADEVFSQLTKVNVFPKA